MSTTPANTVASTGANSRDILVGIHAQSNTGLLILLFEPQPKSLGGRIRGPFRVLHEGSGKYASGIRAVIEENSFFGKAVDFIHAVSSQDGCHDCTHILNANALWALDVESVRKRILVEREKLLDSSIIRRCEQCGQIYDDPTLNYCLEDGASLYTEQAEIETVVMGRKPGRRVTPKEDGIEYVRSAVAKHSNLDLTVHPGSNHRISKAGHTGSMWIIPRHGGVSITANGQAAQRLYREMEKLFGNHHREDRKGYRYFQANRPEDVDSIIAAWSKI